MPSANGHGPKRAILYARVSTDEQASTGYSLAQQIEALREYAAREGYEVLEEVTDPGQSGASLERPGMDRVRDLVAAGDVSVVLAQDRDRFAREPAYLYLLKQEFGEYGTKIRALNDRGDDSPEGELMDGVFDQFAKFERAKTAERTRRGKLRKAREGKVIALAVPRYGFRYNAARDGLVVDEGAMQVVRRIFRMVGVEGRTIREVMRTLQREGVPTPSGRGRWSTAFVRNCILDDCYKPHTYQEVEALVTPEVAARLNPHEYYGIWWFGRKRYKYSYVAENRSSGKVYRRRKHSEWKPREEWVAVPVPHSHIPIQWVVAARAAIKDNRFASSSGGRFWELSGGVFVCAGCGCNMSPGRRHNGSGSDKLYSYYRCPTKTRHGRDACPQRKTYQAEKTEALVWGFVSDLLKNPDRLRAGLEKMIEDERNGSRGDPEREAKAWLEKLAEVDRKRSGYIDLAADGVMDRDELRIKLTALEETRRIAEHELNALRDRAERIEALERDKEALLASYAGAVPGILEEVAPEERQRIYKMLKVRVVAGTDGALEASGAFYGDLGVCTSETPSCSLCPNTGMRPSYRSRVSKNGHKRTKMKIS